MEGCHKCSGVSSMQNWGPRRGQRKSGGKTWDVFKEHFFTFYHHSLYHFTGVTAHSHNDIHHDLIKFFLQHLACTSKKSLKQTCLKPVATQYTHHVQFTNRSIKEINCSNCPNFERVKFEHEQWAANLWASQNSGGPWPPMPTPVSYTHLTLPTILRV